MNNENSKTNESNKFISLLTSLNPPIQIYPNKIKNRIVFKVKTGYKLELFFPETAKLLGSRKKEVDKDKYREDVTKLESVEVVLVHCNLVNNSYQQASKVLFTFVPNKQFGQLITISTHSFTMLKSTKAKFQSIKVWFTDQNNRPLEIEDFNKYYTNYWVSIIKNEIFNRSKVQKICSRLWFFVISKKIW